MKPSVLRLFTSSDRRHLLAVLVLVALTGLLEALTVTALYPFLLIASDPSKLASSTTFTRVFNLSGAQSVTGFLVGLGACILGLVLLTNVVGAYSTWRQLRLVRSFEQGLTVRLFRQYLLRPYPFYLQRNTAELQRTILRDCHEVTSSSLDPAIDILARGVAGLSIFVVLLALQPAVAIVAAAIVALIYGTIHRMGRRRLRELGERVHAADREAARASSEAFSAIKPLKVAQRETYFIDRFARAQERSADDYARYGMRTRLPKYLLEGLVFTAVMTFLVVALQRGGDLVSILPAAGMFAFAGFRLMPTMSGLASSASRLTYARAIVDELVKELEPTVSLPTSSDALRLQGAIRFDAVDFAYETGGRQILAEVSFEVRRGAVVGIVGHTGSGKTTIMDLLLGLLEPTKGRIIIDGAPLTELLRPAWRRSISYVPQQIVLLDDTVARNIAFGFPDEEIDMQRVETAARAANIHDFISEELPEGYQTEVGERGIRLSGGQRQRIAIARALYEDRDVIVFDEATSEVDPITEKLISEAIHRISSSKTIVIVAHRFSAIRACDLILLLEAGRIVARGSYDELLAKAPEFRKMAQS